MGCCPDIVVIPIVCLFLPYADALCALCLNLSLPPPDTPTEAEDKLPKLMQVSRRVTGGEPQVTVAPSDTDNVS